MKKLHPAEIKEKLLGRQITVVQVGTGPGYKINNLLLCKAPRNCSCPVVKNIFLSDLKDVI